MKYIYLMKHWNSLYKDRHLLMNTMVRHITQCYVLAEESTQALPAVYGKNACRRFPHCRQERLYALPAL